jgi:hypothetical protein
MVQYPVWTVAPFFGHGAPTLINQENGRIYYDIDTTPYTQYVWRNGGWHIQANPLDASGVTGVGTGYVVARGEIPLDGTNPTTVATGLATIVAAVATIKSNSALGVGTQALSVNFTGLDGNLDIYGWKPTSAGNCTMVASTGTETIEWVAFGTV